MANILFNSLLTNGQAGACCAGIILRAKRALPYNQLVKKLSLSDGPEELKQRAITILLQHHQKISFNQALVLILATSEESCQAANFLLRNYRDHLSYPRALARLMTLASSSPDGYQTFTYATKSQALERLIDLYQLNEPALYLGLDQIVQIFSKNPQKIREAMGFCFEFSHIKNPAQAEQYQACNMVCAETL